MTDEELNRLVLLSALSQAYAFACQTDDQFNNLSAEEYDLFAAGALAATTVMIKAFGDAIEITDLEAKFHESP